MRNPSQLKRTYLELCCLIMKKLEVKVHTVLEVQLQMKSLDELQILQRLFCSFDSCEVTLCFQLIEIAIQRSFLVSADMAHAIHPSEFHLLPLQTFCFF